MPPPSSSLSVTNTATQSSPLKRSLPILFVSLIIHLGLLIYANHVDTHSDDFGGLKYTDIDWRVVVDGLEEIAGPLLGYRQGVKIGGGHFGRAEGWLTRWAALPIGSPYRRATFRYTPLLPLFLSPHLIHPLLGKLVLTLASLCVPLVILWTPNPSPSIIPKRNSSLTSVITSKDDENKNHQNKDEQVGFWTTHLLWTLNPFVLNITTRGSPEAFICLLVALLHASLRAASNTSSNQSSLKSANPYEFYAAIFLALAASYKIYPVIYTLPIFLFLHRQYGFLGWGMIRFGLVGLATVLLVNVPLWSIWGQEFLDHTFFYHLHRIDHRHNFSSYFLPNYLAFFPSSSSSLSPQLVSSFPPFLAPITSLVSPLLNLARHPLASFLPQCTIVALAATLEPLLGLGTTMFIQTALFIVFNKVCTSQYFLWPLPFLPYTHTTLSTKTITISTLAWIASQILWLSQAYRLEFLSQPVYVTVFGAGLILFLVSIGVIGFVLDGSVDHAMKDKLEGQVGKKKLKSKKEFKVE